MIKIKNKKSLLMDVVKWIIVAALILIVANILRDKLSGSGKETSNLIGDVEDTDRDGIPNYYDKCDCDEGLERDEHNGCPIIGNDGKAHIYKNGYTKDRNKVCEEDIKGNVVTLYDAEK